jgi:LmbE family N-acetylglucosaminyl deacetylase
MKYSVSDIQKLGTILGVYAHPDDECWTAGGVLAAACANGQEVVCVTATRGDAGETADETKWPQAKLAEIRERELEASLALLGDIEHRWFDYGDGTLEAGDIEAIKYLKALIIEIKPDTIVTFGPDGLTGHSDHKAVCAWTLAALKESGRNAKVFMVRESTEKYQAFGKTLHEAGNIYFATEHPLTIAASDADLFFELPEDLYKKKIASLKAHQSQMSALFAHPRGGPALYESAKTECFVLSQ